MSGGVAGFDAGGSGKGNLDSVKVEVLASPAVERRSRLEGSERMGEEFSGRRISMSLGRGSLFLDPKPKSRGCDAALDAPMAGSSAEEALSLAMSRRPSDGRC